MSQQTNPPADPPTPAPGGAAKKCANCRAPLADGAAFCGSCGVQIGPGGRPRDVKLSERVEQLERDRDALAPLVRLAQRAKAAGIDPDDLDDASLKKAAGFKSLLKGGMGAQFLAGMRGFFPGLPGFGGDDDQAPDAPKDE